MEQPTEIGTMQEANETPKTLSKIAVIGLVIHGVVGLVASAIFNGISHGQGDPLTIFLLSVSTPAILTIWFFIAAALRKGSPLSILLVVIDGLLVLLGYGISYSVFTY